jgi:hypothetical protein
LRSFSGALEHLEDAGFWMPKTFYIKKDWSERAGAWTFRFEEIDKKDNEL